MLVSPFTFFNFITAFSIWELSGIGEEMGGSGTNNCKVCILIVFPYMQLLLSKENTNSFKLITKGRVVCVCVCMCVCVFPTHVKDHKIG